MGLPAPDLGPPRQAPPQAPPFDGTISARAYGVLAYLTANPAASQSAAKLAEVFREGREALATAVTELVDAGLIERSRGRRTCPGCDGLVNPPSPKAVTYVVQRQRWVKIGMTTGPLAKRIKTLATLPASVRCPAEMDPAAPLTLRYVIQRDIEHALHERFVDLHVVGEWFRAEPEMLTAIAAEVSA